MSAQSLFCCLLLSLCTCDEDVTILLTSSYFAFFNQQTHSTAQKKVLCYILIMAVIPGRQSKDCQSYTSISQQQQLPCMKDFPFIWLTLRHAAVVIGFVFCLQSAIQWRALSMHSYVVILIKSSSPGCCKYNHVNVHTLVHQNCWAIIWYSTLSSGFLSENSIKIIAVLKALTSSGHTEQTVHLVPWKVIM